MVKATEIQVRELQLELLAQLDDFFKNIGIVYYAFAGTLLGAVRHKGFIPWDNDIDVAVSRQDYKRLQVILKDEESHPFFRFLCYENDPAYLWQHGRIVAKGTYMKTARGFDKLGLSIDVFPLDNQGNSIEMATSNLLEIKRCVQLRIMSYDKKYKGTYRYPDCSDKEKTILKSLFEDCMLDDEEYWVKKHIELALKFQDEDNSFYYGCNSNDKYSVVSERSLYNGTIRVPFENTTIPIPVGYKSILTQYYGDYTILPKESERIGIKKMEIFLL